MMFSDKEQKEIEIEFLRSWEQIELFFSEDNLPWLVQMLPLIHTLRARGYDRQLRAGQSMITFIVSRSREHGLRGGQPSLMFEITGERTLRASLIGDNVNVTVISPRIEISTEIEGLLLPLLAYPID